MAIYNFIGPKQYWMSTMLKRPAIGLLLATLFLAGCESMSESQCKVADWGRVGFADGARGVYENRLADYTEDCGKILLRPDEVIRRHLPSLMEMSEEKFKLHRA